MFTMLRWGVLRLRTPVGSRYVRPSFLERLYLLWVFRHFEVLPNQVLSRLTRSLVEDLCARQHSADQGFLYSITDQPVIGTVERLTSPSEEPSVGSREIAPVYSRRSSET